MSKTVDERVVSMQFDNKRFEQGVATTMSTLEKLKQKLNFSGATKGFEEIDSASKRVDMSVLGNSVETVRAKFSALQVMGITALTNITNQAVNAGKKMVSALTIDPMKAGFSEYETQIGAVQTILANTESKGSTLQDVNRALDELNTYADKTIYNFTEMTKNIGTFTAAGVDLDTSVQSIKGIANLAAVSGSTSQQASTAMYQLSQALAAGKVQLMDWNSVVNAGMGGELFQTALKRTATQMGTNVDAMIKKYGSFRESLTKGEWLTSEVLTETLSQLSGAYTEADLIAKGYTKEQAAEIIKLANTAQEAATKVKTFTQLWDTLKEAAQSGWTQTWEIIIGDFEEAKEFLTGISDTLGPMINASAEARNKVLSGALSSGWKQLLGEGISDETGYKDEITKLARENGDAFDKLIEETVEDGGTFQDALKKGLEDGLVTSDMMSKSVTNLAEKVRGMTAEERKAAGYTDEHVKALEKMEKGLKDGSISMDEYVEKIKSLSGREKLILALKNAFDGIMNIVKPIKEAFGEIFAPLTSADVTSAIDNIVALSEKFKEMTQKYAPQIKSTFKGIFSIFDMLKKVVVSVGNAFLKLSGSEGVASFGELILNTFASIGDFFTNMNKDFDTKGLTGVLSNFADGISTVFGKATEGIKGFGDILSSVGQWIAKVAKMIWEPIKKTFTWISENVSVGDIFAGLAGGGIFAMAKKLGGVFDKIKDAIDGLFGKKDGGTKGLKENFVEVLDTVKGSLESFTQGIKVWSLVGIAAAVGILAHALRTISELKAVDIGKSLIAIAAMLKMLTMSFSSMTKTLTGFESKGIVKSSLALILVAKAVDILADVMVKLAGLSFANICKGLFAVGIALVELAGAAKIINKVKIPLSTSVTILALAKACDILGDALQKFGKMSWDEIGRGLTAMGGALLELTGAIAILKKAGGGGSLLGSASILLLVQGLSDLATALKQFGSMQWDEIGRGLSAMGGALAELGLVLGLLGKFGGFSSIFASGAIVIVIQGLDDLAAALKKFGEMSWDEIGRGLTAMGGALLEVGGITGAVGKIAGMSSLFGAGSILITIQGLDDLANALKKFGGMSWDEIGRGLAGMGGALLEVGGISGALGALTGLSGLLGSGTILATIQGLDTLAEGFKKFGEMSWDEIGRGLVGMGGALAEVGIISGSLGWLTGFAGLIGSGSLLLTIQGLGDLADAFKKFGEMSWDEIKQGLAAMGGALGETALGGLLNTFSGLGAASISEMAAPLGTLADSMKKWAGVTVPEGLGIQLGSLASGIFSFTLDGLGASAIAEVAAPLGVMADSVKKWSGVTVPEGLGTQLKTLANGIGSFTFSGLGASAIAEVATPLGNLADSVKKWSGVSIPEGLEASLTQIANGIKAFSWAFMGGWSIGTIVEPLGALPESIKKWNGVSIPEGLEEGLTSLSTGLKGFSWLFLAGWSLSTITGPLGELVDDVLKWKDVSIPDSLKDDLSALADAIKAFSWAFLGGWSLGAVTGPLGDLAESVKKWKGVSVPDGLGEDLKSLSGGVKSFSGIQNISTGIDGMKSIADTSTKLAGINFASICVGLVSLVSGLNSLSAIDVSNLGSLDSAASSIKRLAQAMKQATSQFTSVGTTIMAAISKGMMAGTPTLAGIANTAIVAIMQKTIISKAPIFMTSAKILMTAFTKGVISHRGQVIMIFTSIISSAVGKVRGSYSKLYSAGKYLVAGFASGITVNTFKAEAAAAAMAKAAQLAAEKALGIESPSKELYKDGSFAGQGFVNALLDYKSESYDAGYTMANSARSGLNKAVDHMGSLLSDELNTQPTITPVVDLSAIRASTKDILGMLDLDPSVGIVPNVHSINRIMNRRSQNGANDDVVDAIGKLRKDLGSVNNTTYSINGITYNSDSDVGEAIETLVRAIRIEGRV